MKYNGKRLWSYTLSTAFTTALILTAGCSQKSPADQQIDQLSLQSTMTIPSTVKANAEVLLNFKLDDQTKALQIGAVGNTGYQYKISKITLNGLKLSTQTADDSCINADGSYASFDGNTGCELALTADVASPATTASLEIVLNSGQVIDKTINFIVENPLYPTLGSLLINGLNPNTNTIFTHNDFGVFVFNLNSFALNNLVLSDNQKKSVGSLKELAPYTMAFIKPNTTLNHPTLLKTSNSPSHTLYLDAANLASTIPVTEISTQNPNPQLQQNLYIQSPNQDYKLSLTPVTDMTINTASLVLPQGVNIKGNNPFVNAATLNKGSTYTLTLNAQQDAYIANQTDPKLLISYTGSDKSTHYIQDNISIKSPTLSVTPFVASKKGQTYTLTITNNSSFTWQNVSSDDFNDAALTNNANFTYVPQAQDCKSITSLAPAQSCQLSYQYNASSVNTDSLSFAINRGQSNLAQGRIKLVNATKHLLFTPSKNQKVA